MTCRDTFFRRKVRKGGMCTTRKKTTWQIKSAFSSDTPIVLKVHHLPRGHKFHILKTSNHGNFDTVDPICI